MNETFYKILDNGVRIVFRESTSEVAYVGVMVGVGTRDEDEKENGLAHYIEHCVFKGCTHISQKSSEFRATFGKNSVLTSKDIIERIEGVGGEINAYTTKEETTFYAATGRTHWKKTLELISDMILHPTFPKEETDKEVEVILDEIDSYEDSPSELIYDDFENIVFQGNKLAMPILGTKKSVRAISRKKETALRFMARNYAPDKMVVFIQGNLHATQVFEYVSHVFATLPLSTVNQPLINRYTPVKMTAENRTYKKHTHQVHVMMGGRAYPIGHKKQLALYLLNNILGGGSMSSRLNLSLREKRGLVYTIESQYTPLSDSGYWSIYFASDAKDKDECIRLIHKELDKLCKQPLSNKQMQRALKQLHGQMAISAENQENNVLAMAKLMLYHNAAPTWEETFKQIEQLQAGDLLDTAREIFTKDNLSVLTYE